MSNNATMPNAESASRACHEHEGSDDDRCPSLNEGRRRRRNSRSRIQSSISRTSTSISSLLLFTAALFLSRTPPLLHVQAGLSIGGVTSTDTCYSALQNAQRPDSNVVDQDGFVQLINQLSDNAFTAFQQDSGNTGNWDFFPVTEFTQLPSGLREQFYKHACGGAYVICDNAFLYTDGTGGENGGVPDPQQEVYLYQVCIGVEQAIEDARPPPTPKPTPPSVVVVTTEPTPATIVTTPGPTTNNPVTPMLPPCPPLYKFGSYNAGDLVSVKDSTNLNADEYTYYQCKLSQASGWCSQAAYEPGNYGNADQAWNFMGQCNPEGMDPPPSATPRPTFPSPPTYSPTTVPPPPTPPAPRPETEPPGMLFSGAVPLKVTYHAAVSSAISTEELQALDNDVRLKLLGAMNTWSFKSTNEYQNFERGSSSLGKKKKKKKKVRTRNLRASSSSSVVRELGVRPDPMIDETFDQKYMDVIDVLCSTNITVELQETDHCIQVTTNLTLIFEDEPIGSERQAIEFFETKFDQDCLDGIFLQLIRPEEVQQEFRVIYPVPNDEDLRILPLTSEVPTPKPTQSISQILNGRIENQQSNDEDDGGGSNVASIVAGVCVALLVVGLLIGFFVYRRYNSDDDYSYSETSSKKKEFDPATDLDGGELENPRDFENGDGDNDSRSSGSGSSRDEFSSSESQSSGSMQSYSGSETSRSSRSSRSTTTSRSSYGSRRSRGSRSSTGSGSQTGSYSSRSHTSRSSASRNSGQVSAEASASESNSYSSGNESPYTSGTKDSDANAPYDRNNEGMARAQAASVPATQFDRATSQGSESTGGSRSTAGSNSRGGHSEGLHSASDNDNRSNASSSVGELSDPAKMMEQDEDEVSSEGESRDTTEGSAYTGGSASKDSQSMASSSEGGSGSAPFVTNADLLGEQDRSRSSKGTTPDDDSSAGSSGWDSSDGDSSVDTGSVDSYDPNTIHTGDLASSKSGTGSSTTGESSFEEHYRMNPAVNPVVQPSVSMLPIVAEAENEESSTQMTPNSEESSSAPNGSLHGMGRHRDQPPLGGDIQEAIEMGDWEAVGTTAAILASESGSDSDSNMDDNATRDDATRDSSSAPSGGSAMMSVGSGTVDEDDIRAAEIDQLVESGNWDGVVAVAARYADEADDADSQLGRSPRNRAEGTETSGSNQGSSTGIPSSKSGTSSSMTSVSIGSLKSTGSAGSVSVETADASSVYSNTTRDESNMSQTTYSDNNSLDDITMGDGDTTISGNDSPDAGTHSSSITTSYTSGGNITSSMVSAVSTEDQQEKHQMILFRAEVEALVRRVVPDEIDNVDDIMVQFSGREEELIETLRSMQEKSIAQRARAAVQRSAKKEAGRSGRSFHDESSEGQSVTTDGQSMTTDGEQSITTGRSGFSESVSSRGSRTEQDTRGDGDDGNSYSSYSRSDSRSSVSSYTSGSSSDTGSSHTSRSGVSGSEYSESQMGESLGMISVTKSAGSVDRVKTSPGLSNAIDASDWRAVGDVSDKLTRDGKSSSQPSGNTSMSKETIDDLDDMIDDGNWSGIIESASNMRGGHVARSDSNSGDDLD